MKLLAAAALSLAAVGLARPADACGSVMWREHQLVAISEDGHGAPSPRLFKLLDSAQQQLDAGHYAAALTFAKSVLAHRSFQNAPAGKIAKAHRIAAQASFALGHNAEAEAHFAIAVKTLPELSGQYARAQLANGHAAEAQAQLEATARQHKLMADGWVVLAQMRRQVGDAPGALTAAGEALKLQPELAPARQLQAELAHLPTTATVAAKIH